MFFFIVVGPGAVHCHMSRQYRCTSDKCTPLWPSSFSYRSMFLFVYLYRSLAYSLFLCSFSIIFVSHKSAGYQQGSFLYVCLPKT